MSKDIKGSNKHLTLSDRVFIEQSLNKSKRFNTIAKTLGKNPWSIEKDNDGRQRTKVFYCDPYASNQKRRLERNHEFIRHIIPKGRNMHNLTKDNVAKMSCHINSLSRNSLNGQTPFDLAEFLINKKVLTLLGLHKVSPDKVLLKPALLHK